VNALKLVGECEYAMLIAKADGTIFAVRADRSLYVAETNYGLLFNTRRDNLDNAILRTNHVCAVMDWPRVVLTNDEHKIMVLKEWTVHEVRDGIYLQWWDIKDEVANINDPPRRAVVVHGKEASSTKGKGDDGGPLNLPNALVKVDAYLTIMDMLPFSMTDSDVRKMLDEMIGGPATGWWDYGVTDLGEIPNILSFFWKSHPEFAPSDEKDQLWNDIVAALPNQPYQAATTFAPDFVFPYFHNSIDELRTVMDGAESK
jgi:hypothetical protein